MTLLWVEDNLPAIVDVFRDLETALNRKIDVECHVSDAFQRIKGGEEISVFILDIMLPLGGVSIPKELIRYQKKYEMSLDTEFSGILLAEYILDNKPDACVVVLSDFCEYGDQLGASSKVAFFEKHRIDREFDRFVSYIEANLAES